MVLCCRTTDLVTAFLLTFLVRDCCSFHYYYSTPIIARNQRSSSSALVAASTKLVRPFSSSSSSPSFVVYASSNNKNDQDNNNKSKDEDDENHTETTNEPAVVVALPQEEEKEPIRTIGGGADMIFEMARQMLLWDETEDALQYQEQRERSRRSSPSRSRSRASVLPRWRPIRGVSDANPAFRTTAPMMNSQGYAGTIWRNARKANKPSLWRHSIRTYDRMGQNPAKPVVVATSRSGTIQQPTTTSTTTTTSRNRLKVQRTNLHHEGALVACAKLGLWKKALQIYQDVQEEQGRPTTSSSTTAPSRQYNNINMNNNNKKVFITDNMVLSLIRSCVVGSRDRRYDPSSSSSSSFSSSGGGDERSLEERRAPLDACLEVLLEIEDKHGLPLVARHLNPIAAAYQKLGLIQDASNLLNSHLQDRTSGPEEEDGDDPFNVNDVHAKDKGSYSLLVKGAVSEGNWEGAVDALRTMTEAGLYPNSRNLNSWTEVSNRKTKQRATRSWKKKRDEYWLESVR